MSAAEGAENLGQTFQATRQFLAPQALESVAVPAAGRTVTRFIN